MRLSNKVVLITGSTTGIGRAIAERCVQEGARVIIHGLEESLADDCVRQLGDANAVCHVEDLAREGCADRLVSRAIGRFGRLDVVVNNAALVASGNIQSTDEKLLQQMLTVNTVAPFLLIKAALPYLQSARGSVLNIGSVNAWCGEAGLLPYSISKGALTTLTRNLGDALMQGYGVRVNQINPGWVLTENEASRKLAQGFCADWETKLPRTIAPAGRLLHPKEIAAVAIGWISDEMGPVSGQVCELEQYPLIGRNLSKECFL
ncbi:MAG: SDR family NAD(P)-dependent oxidoreductase [Verrucomicrobiota bacterium]